MTSNWKNVLRLAALWISLAPYGAAWGLGEPVIVAEQRLAGDFSLVDGTQVATMVIQDGTDVGVARAADDFIEDVGRVTGLKPVRRASFQTGDHHIILTGILGQNLWIDRLVKDRRIDASAIQGRWESYVIQVVDHPFPGVDEALVVAGSDKRGAIYGLYDLSEQMGVSPWYWWADVPVHHHDRLFVRPGPTIGREPAVKYRGIFLNDEAPALTGWAKERFGGLNHTFYEKVFELILRLHGNYLWPAMWGNAFNEDDPLNPVVADQYGIVMGTSHHEPMMRAQQEWKRHGQGPWNYATNGDVLRNFWEEGIRRNRNFENFVTIGMRGDGDMPMTASEQDADIGLLEKIVADQRAILAENPPDHRLPAPQLWALYKEVQLYYERGMRVPDDVTLLWCDDNWGNVRRLPTDGERGRSGGAGMYYHFDYVGDPRNYKWINTNQLSKVWQQMRLTYDLGADRVWIVNVGDLKPMERPIEFFLTMARDPTQWQGDKVGAFVAAWARREFGPAHADDIAAIVAETERLVSRRKPELLSPDSFSLVNYEEAEQVVADYGHWVSRAEAVAKDLPAEMQDAYFEMVLHPLQAAGIVTDLYVTAARNRLYAAQGRASTNRLAAEARSLFAADAALTDHYNHEIAGGKWDHMMDQTHIGYTNWQEPPQNNMPSVTEISLPRGPAFGVAIDGQTESWPSSKVIARLPPIDRWNDSRRWIDLFNKGQQPATVSVTADQPWIRWDPVPTTLQDDERLWVHVDWALVPTAHAEGHIDIRSANGEQVQVTVEAINPSGNARGFAEDDGYVSIEAAHYDDHHEDSQSQLVVVPDFGRTQSGVMLWPDRADSRLPQQGAPWLDYPFALYADGALHLSTIFAASLPVGPNRSLRYAVSVDDQPPQVIDLLGAGQNEGWAPMVSDNVRISGSDLGLVRAGSHHLKVWLIDPNLVLEKLVLDLGGVRPSYLGPPETHFIKEGEK